ncbi:hypothetical protein AB0J83_48030 [Actinoplanes sp. NPDC049596]|uniref:hypothetical protein n=1 Tax=unclassified Actinoplanes TaxID=2626549 RepID=UPI0034346FC1
MTDSKWKPTFERSIVGLTVRFTGTCPRCQHPTVFDVPKVIPGSGTVRGAEEFTMYCQCGHPHKDHPDGDNSCGAYWSYEGDL